MARLQIKTRNNGEITLQEETVQKFKESLRGELIRIGEAGYDDARSIWNAVIDRQPALIASCLGVADVVTCVKFARAHGVNLSIKGGGHNISGLAVCDGGLMLDLSRMRGVWVDPSTRTARAQGGCLLGDVDRETQVHGLAAVLGFISNTGIAGLTLGGGFGYLTRRFGWTSDSVLSMDMVTAGGSVVRASENENSDLFWALRGGGGNFGVVTSFEYRLFPVGPEIIAGAIAWPAEDARRVLDMYRSLTEQAPRELTCVAALRMAPPAPWLAKEIHGKPIVALFFCHTGTISEGEKLAAPIKAFGSPVGDIVQRRSYVSQQSLLDATQPKGRRYYWKSEYLPTLEPELLAKTIEHARGMLSPHSVILLFHLDGELNRLSDAHSAVGNRTTRSVLNIAASWEKSEDDHANVEWARAAWRDLRRFSTGGTYVNFLTEEEGDERIRAAYGNNYERLAEVKSKWDPDNLFRMNKNIAPQR
ncbi:MAG TPA: FAD-binding oxidoreductase [Candidatus Binatia bacterium]|nr:FAD-binding oxidoreductase [Candidatus Binatia bacterium]